MKWAIEEPLMREMSEVEVLELKRQAERDAWDQKHPRCETCGQFLKKKPPLKENELSFSLRQDDRDQWYSHYVRDYWGEYDHV